MFNATDIMLVKGEKFFLLCFQKLVIFVRKSLINFDVSHKSFRSTKVYEGKNEAENSKAIKKNCSCVRVYVC